MPFVLIFAGIVLVISGIRGTHTKLGALLVDDFSGENNFIYWVVAMVLIGSLGYIPKFKSFSVAFMGLVILVLFLTRGKGQIGGGFFEQFTNQLGVTRMKVPIIPAANRPGPIPF